MWAEYRPKHAENRMAHEGDVHNARNAFYKHKPSNLVFLIEKRFAWMNQYISKGDRVLEVGCGPGFSRTYIRKDARLLMTDNAKLPWVDKKVDALNMPFKAGSFDVVICGNMIHHLPFPKRFFKEVHRVLKPGGRLIIQEINCSHAMQAMLRAMRHEGWSFKANVYSKTVPCTDKKDLWSANCAIPNLLWDDMKRFRKEVPQFKVIHHEFSEFIVMPLSGGVTAKTKTINLPFWMLRIIDKADTALVRAWPSMFACQRRVVLQR
jgi:ubiquinone/menaquinone biosynthesis C-methylase UbiE